MSWPPKITRMPDWFRRQGRRWNAISRRGWRFGGPGVPLPGFVALVMYRGRTVVTIRCALSEAGKTGELRALHTDLLEAAERVAFAGRRAA